MMGEINIGDVIRVKDWEELKNTDHPLKELKKMCGNQVKVDHIVYMRDDDKINSYIFIEGISGDYGYPIECFVLDDKGQNKISLSDVHLMASKMEYYEFKNWVSKRLFGNPETIDSSELLKNVFLSYHG